MNQQYSARLVYTSDSEREVQVTSAKCHYWIWLSEEDCTLRGPGVRENSQVDELPKTGGKLDDEDFAILLVLLFENGLWPKG